MHVIDVRDPGKLQGSYLYEVDNAMNDVVIEQSTHTLLMYHSNKSTEHLASMSEVAT